MTPLETLQRWTASQQLVTDGRRHSGRVIGYTHVAQSPYIDAKAQIQLTTGGVRWLPLWKLRPLGLQHGGAA